jgi:4-alpha-glucanotransferase
MPDSNHTRPRSSGILLHVTSLPGPHGIGDLGPVAHRWVDTLASAKQTWWQILPLGPPGAGDSPYQCFSAFAGNPMLISPELLRTDGLLARGDLAPDRFLADRVDFARVRKTRGALLTRAYDRFATGNARNLRQAVDKIRKAQAGWLDDFALFMALRDAYPDQSWTDWPRDLVLRKPAALAAVRTEFADAIARHAFAQFLFYRQMADLKSYANSRGVRLIGDLPIFISAESSDVWANPHLFRLDRNRRPTHVAGVPPDYFSATGQRWGNPLYHWPAMAKDGYAWWIDRFRATLETVDLVRIDHFRGFAAAWHVPADSPTAIKGRWVRSPGRELFSATHKALGSLPFIAEDLGLITPDVDALRRDFGLPGMRVLQFAFGGSPTDAFLPHNYDRNTVVYTGTHDNDTTRGWYRALDRKQKGIVRRYVPNADRDVARALTRQAWGSVADLAVVPLQDVLNLDSRTRMNTPGRPTGNWGWRASPAMIEDGRLDQLGELTEHYARVAQPARPAAGRSRSRRV